MMYLVEIIEKIQATIASVKMLQPTSDELARLLDQAIARLEEAKSEANRLPKGRRRDRDNPEPPPGVG